MTGPEGAGKTTLLYQMILRKKEWKATPTIGFNYEEISSERGDRAGIWDVGGSVSVRNSCFKGFIDLDFDASDIQECSLFRPSLRY